MLPFAVRELMTILLLAGVLMLLLSLVYVRKLTLELPQGINRNSWRLMGIFVMLFIGGYVAFFVLMQGARYDRHEVLVTAVFFLGAVFVLMVCVLAYNTMRELKRMVVLEQETITDPLMGIFNRRFLDRRLHEEMLRSKRHGLDLSLMLIDVDHFKRVNDTWGHQNGDIVLRHLAQLLANTVRQTDLLARYGGEELVILLPHTTRDETAALAERIRRTVEQTPVLIATGGANGYHDLRITVSIGLSCMFSEDDSPCDLLERADKALYQAKAAGRNRVVACAGPTETQSGDVATAERPGAASAASVARTSQAAAARFR